MGIFYWVCTLAGTAVSHRWPGAVVEAGILLVLPGAAVIGTFQQGHLGEATPSLSGRPAWL